jgi:hypothetical protein
MKSQKQEKWYVRNLVIDWKRFRAQYAQELMESQMFSSALSGADAQIVIAELSELWMLIRRIQCLQDAIGGGPRLVRVVGIVDQDVDLIDLMV